MTQQEILAAAEYAARTHTGWTQPTTPQPIYNGQGWLVRYDSSSTSTPMIVVRNDDHRAYCLEGDIAACFIREMEPDSCRLITHCPGLPTSSVRHIGHDMGRYQIFDDGTIYHYRGRQPYLASRHKRLGQGCYYIAIFDLRGFTSWVKNNASDEKTQDIVAQLELIVQENLGGLSRFMFFKGTGDGVLAIPLAGWKSPAEHDAFPYKFLRACAKVIHSAKEILPPELALGCGVSYGELTPIFSFGMPDYVGEELNTAAKLQQDARNEIIVSEAFVSEAFMAYIGHPAWQGNTRHSPEALIARLEQMQKR